MTAGVRATFVDDLSFHSIQGLRKRALRRAASATDMMPAKAWCTVTKPRYATSCRPWKTSSKSIPPDSHQPDVVQADRAPVPGPDHALSPGIEAVVLDVDVEEARAQLS